MTGGLQQLWSRLPPGFFRTAFVRFSLLLIFAGSLGLAWWSVNRLQPLEKLLQKQSEKLAHLEDEVMKLELKWNQQEADQVAAKFKKAQEQVFSNQDEIIKWNENLKHNTNQFILEVRAQTGHTQACPLPNKVFSVIPASIDLQAPLDVPASKPPYKRLLDFAQNLSTETKRIDLVELTVSGNSNSVTTAHVGVQLWSQENARP
jgi:hypothetical protein